MPRQPNPILHISFRDINALRMLWCVEHAPKELLNLTDSRITTLCKLGYVQKCKNLNNSDIIRCTDKGRKFISKLPSFENRRAYVSSFAPEHNIKLAYIYASLSYEQQLHWATEHELAGMYRDRLDELRYTDYDRWKELIDRPWSPADGGLVSEAGELEQAIEVITNHYGDLEVKETFAQVMSSPIEYYKI